MEIAVFSLFSLLALVSALVVVTHKNAVYSTMSLVVTLVSLAALFVLLGAPFIATLQVLVYAGAIMVLFLFVIMLLNVARNENEAGEARPGQKWGTILGGGVFAGTLLAILWKTYSLAQLLFTRYLLAFEIVGLLLLVAVVAASVVARRLSAEEAALNAETALPREEA